MKVLEFLSTLNPRNIVQYNLHGSNSMCLYAHEIETRFKQSLPKQYDIVGDVTLTEKGIYFFKCIEINAMPHTLQQQLVGRCPVCGIDGNFDYQDGGIDDETYTYTLTCLSCKSDMKEVNNIVFDEYININRCVEPIDDLHGRFFFYDRGNGVHRRVDSRGNPIPKGRQEPIGYLQGWDLDARIWIETTAPEEAADGDN